MRELMQQFSLVPLIWDPEGKARDPWGEYFLRQDPESGWFVLFNGKIATDLQGAPTADAAIADAERFRYRNIALMLQGRQVEANSSIGAGSCWDSHREFSICAAHARKAMSHVLGDVSGIRPTVGKHEAVNHEHLRLVYEEARQSNPRFADTLAWRLWWDVVDADRLALLSEPGLFDDSSVEDRDRAET